MPSLDKDRQNIQNLQEGIDDIRLTVVNRGNELPELGKEHELLDREFDEVLQQARDVRHASYELKRQKDAVQARLAAAQRAGERAEEALRTARDRSTTLLQQHHQERTDLTFILNTNEESFALMQESFRQAPLLYEEATVSGELAGIRSAATQLRDELCALQGRAKEMRAQLTHLPRTEPDPLHETNLLLEAHNKEISSALEGALAEQQKCASRLALLMPSSARSEASSYSH